VSGSSARAEAAPTNVPSSDPTTNKRIRDIESYSGLWRQRAIASFTASKRTKGRKPA
jgi:hypothetical protein